MVDIDPLAVCNDGSPAGYYVIPATTQPDVFLVYLEGGMCVVCAQRGARGAGPRRRRSIHPLARHF